ncbi:LysR substrate-binding domain-containing protein [Cupriavidus basilensis]
MASLDRDHARRWSRCSRRARAAQGRPVRLADLAGLPFVMYEDDFVLYRVILDACEAAGFTPQIAGQSRHWDFIGELVAADVGVAILPAPIAEPAGSGARGDPAVGCAAVDVGVGAGLAGRLFVARCAERWLACGEQAFGTAREIRLT